MTIELDEQISVFLKNQAQTAQGNVFETESFYSSDDLLCEGPIEGFANKNGETVGYLEIDDALSSVGSSIYYNNIPVVDYRTNLFNFAQTQISFDTGTERKRGSFMPSSLFEYKNRIYDIPKAIAYKNTLTEPTVFKPSFFSQPFKLEDASVDQKIKDFVKYKQFSTPVSHRVLNRFAALVQFSISIDTLYSIEGGGSTAAAPITFMIEAENLSARTTSYLFFNASFVAKGGPLILPFFISLNKNDGDLKLDPFPEMNITIYSLRQSVQSQTNVFRTFSLDSVVEYVPYRMSYPYCSFVSTRISSKHFNAIPTRSYDCKLLKIRVPENYDGEAREYVDNWSGNFNVSLKWTNNPAWVFYDLCINSRYGMGRGHINELDLNKWQFLTLSKFCDELVKTNSRTKYDADLFTYDNNIQYGQANYNVISVTVAATETLENLKQKYPIGSILYLYDLKNTYDENVDYNFKKIICSVSLSGTTATIKLCNDFGPRKILESDLRGNLFSKLMDYVKQDPSKNIENEIKLFILKYIIGDASLGLFLTQDEAVSKNQMKLKIFDASLNVYKGYCVAKHPEYDDYLEPRFSCNLLINSSTEGLKILSDLSSIFRGIFYFKNGLLNLTSDVKQKPTYIFTNSNVKDGLFTYASSDLNTSFSVAKVPYLDKSDNFKDKVVYVEDQDLIKSYGIVEKDILSFGITSRSEAQRIGRWFLATGKLESEVVGFSTGLEATVLQIGNVIRLSDNLKNANTVSGKIVSLDFQNNYIYIDREVSAECLGKNIKIFSLINDIASELDFSILEVDNTNLRLKIISNAYMSWCIVNKIIVEDSGLKLTGTVAGGNVFDKKAYTNNSFVNNCQISFSVVYAVNHNSVVGLSKINNPKIDESDINYAFQVLGDGTAAAVLSILQDNLPFNLNVTDTSVKDSDLLRITYDGENVRYYRNETLVYGPVSVSATTKGKPLHGVVAMNVPNRTIKNILFSKYPDAIYGKFSNLRSGANFSIYINENDLLSDLYKIISINEVSANEYTISAMKYTEEKFDIIEKNEYVDQAQNKPKEIVFSTSSIVSELFTDAQMGGYTKIESVNYVSASNSSYDYSFLIEQEILNDNFFSAQYEALTVDFISMFTDLINQRGVDNVFGIMCIVNRNGKSLNFNLLKEDARKVKVFLGESFAGNISAKTSIDLYAFDLNYKIINV